MKLSRNNKVDFHPQGESSEQLVRSSRVERMRGGCGQVRSTWRGESAKRVSSVALRANEPQNFRRVLKAPRLPVAFFWLILNLSCEAVFLALSAPQITASGSLQGNHFPANKEVSEALEVISKFFSDVSIDTLPSVEEEGNAEPTLLRDATTSIKQENPQNRRGRIGTSSVELEPVESFATGPASESSWEDGGSNRRMQAIASQNDHSEAEEVNGTRKNEILDERESREERGQKNSGAATHDATSFDAYRRVNAGRGDVCVVFDYDDTFASAGAWVVNKWFMVLRHRESHYQRGVAFPGVGGVFYRIAEGPVNSGGDRKFVRPVRPILLSARLSEGLLTLFRSKWFRGMLSRVLHRGYVRWKGWRGRIGPKGFRGGNSAASWHTGYRTKSSLRNILGKETRTREQLEEMSGILKTSGTRSLGSTLLTSGTRFALFGDIKGDDAELFSSLVSMNGTKIVAAFLHMVYDGRRSCFKEILKRHEKSQRTRLDPAFVSSTLERRGASVRTLHIDYVVRRHGSWQSYDANRMPYDGRNCSGLKEKDIYLVGRQLGDTVRDIIAHHLKSFVREAGGEYSEHHRKGPEMPILFLRCRGILTGIDKKKRKAGNVQVSFVPAEIDGSADKGVPVVVYRTVNLVAAAGYFMRMWDEEDAMRLIVDTIRDQRDLGDPYHRGRRRQWADLLADVMLFKPVMEQIRSNPSNFSEAAVALLRDARDAVFAAEDFLCFSISGWMLARNPERCQVVMDTSRKLGSSDPLYDSTCGLDFIGMQDMKRVFLSEEASETLYSRAVQSNREAQHSCFPDGAFPGASWPSTLSMTTHERSERQEVSAFLELKRRDVIAAADDLRDWFLGRCLSFLHWKTMGALELMSETIIVAELLSTAEKDFFPEMRNLYLRFDNLGRPVGNPQFSTTLSINKEKYDKSYSSDDSAIREPSTSAESGIESLGIGSVSQKIIPKESNKASMFLSLLSARGPSSSSSEKDPASRIKKRILALLFLESYLPSFSATVWPRALWRDGDALRLLASTLQLYAKGELWMTRKMPVGSNTLIGQHFLIPDPENAAPYRIAESMSLRVTFQRIGVLAPGKLDWRANSQTEVRKKWRSYVGAYVMAEISFHLKRHLCKKDGASTRYLDNASSL